MNASYVLGQTSLTSIVTSQDTQSGLRAPQGLAYDSLNHQLYVSDAANARVLAFNIANISNDMNATSVLGQSNFTSATTGVSQTAMSNNSSAYAGLAFDAGNNRNGSPTLRKRWGVAQAIAKLIVIVYNISIECLIILLVLLGHVAVA
jgi:hypothetical protein